MHNLSTQYKNVLCDTVVMEPDPIMPQFCAFFNASRVTDVCPHYCTIPYTCNVGSFFSRIELDTCQANYLLLYEQLWVTEGTDLLAGGCKKQLHQLNKNLLQTARSDLHYFFSINDSCAWNLLPENNKKCLWFHNFRWKHKDE